MTTFEKRVKKNGWQETDYDYGTRCYVTGIKHFVNFLLLVFLIGIVLGLLSKAHAAELKLEFKVAEASWQLLNITDLITTDELQVRKYPHCYKETGAWQYVAGDHPSTKKLVLTAVAFGSAHYLVTKALSNSDAPLWLQRSWSYVTITASGVQIRSSLNHLNSGYGDWCESQWSKSK